MIVTMKTLDYVFCVSGVLMLLLPVKGLWHCFQFGGEYYIISTEKAVFNEAKGKCGNMNSKLVQLHDQEVFKKVTDMIAPHEEQYWVGLTKDKQTDSFKWDNEAEPQKSNWIPNEPNDSGPRVRLCRIYGSKVFHKHRLADASCWEKYNFICQKRQEFGKTAVTKGTQKDAYMNYCCLFMPFPLADSRLECAQACILEPKCEGFVYNKTTSTCTMFTKSEYCTENMLGVIITALERQLS